MDKNQRHTGIGGSDIAPILGISRFKTAVELWYEKVNQIVSDETSSRCYKTKRMHWGKKFEDDVLDEYEKLTGNRIFTDNKKIIHPNYRWLYAHVDATTTQANEKIIVEAKTAAYNQGDWGEEGTDHIPLEYMCQCQHYMNVTGVHITHLPVLFLNDLDFKIYQIEYSQQIIDEITPAIDKFWNVNVKQNVPPETVDYEDVKIIYNNPLDKAINANNNVTKEIAELSQIKMSMKMLSQQESKAKKIVAEHMGNNTVLMSEDGEQKIATFKPRKDGARVFRLTD